VVITEGAQLPLVGSLLALPARSSRRCARASNGLRAVLH